MAICLRSCLYCHLSAGSTFHGEYNPLANHARLKLEDTIKTNFLRIKQVVTQFDQNKEHTLKSQHILFQANTLIGLLVN